MPCHTIALEIISSPPSSLGLVGVFHLSDYTLASLLLLLDAPKDEAANNQGDAGDSTNKPTCNSTRVICLADVITIIITRVKSWSGVTRRVAGTR